MIMELRIGQSILKAVGIAVIVMLAFPACRKDNETKDAALRAEAPAVRENTGADAARENSAAATSQSEEEAPNPGAGEPTPESASAGASEAKPVSMPLTSSVASKDREQYSLLVTTNPNFSEQVGRYDPFVPVDPVKLDPLLGVQLFPDDYRMAGYIKNGDVITAALAMGDKHYAVHVGCVIHEEMLLCDNKVLVAGRWRENGDEYATDKKIDIALIKQEGIWIKEINPEYTVLYREYEGEPREVKVKMKRRKREVAAKQQEGQKEMGISDVKDNINEVYMQYITEREESKISESEDFSSYVDRKIKESRKPETYIEKRRKEMEKGTTKPEETKPETTTGTTEGAPKEK